LNLQYSRVRQHLASGSYQLNCHHSNKYVGPVLVVKISIATKTHHRGGDNKKDADCNNISIATTTDHSDTTTYAYCNNVSIATI
jgi:hypothetical protein